MEQFKKYDACLCTKCKQVFDRSNLVVKMENHYGVNRIIKVSPCCGHQYRSVELPGWTLRWIKDKQEEYWEVRK